MLLAVGLIFFFVGVFAGLFLFAAGQMSIEKAAVRDGVIKLVGKIYLLNEIGET